MQRRRRILKVLSIVALTLFAMTGIAPGAQAAGVPPKPVKPYDYVCTDNSGQAQNWNGKDPYTCVGDMDVYDANELQVVHVKDGAQSNEVVDCTPRDDNDIVQIFTPSGIIGYGAAEFIWVDSWIIGYNCLNT